MSQALPVMTPVSKYSILREKPRQHEQYRTARATDHDRLYKELLQTFFAEAMELFFPDVYAAMDFRDVRFLPQEVYTDVTAGEKRNVDLLAELRLNGEEGAVIIHTESQAQPQAAFNERMYLYFSRLYEKYRCRILPIAIFSHGAAREEETTFQVAFPFKQVLTFSFLKVEVHKQKWREYIRRDNPVAAALLSQMNIRPEERVEVKKEFLRMLVRLQLDPARMQLITGFFESYLILSEEEELTLRQEIEGLDRQEAEQIFRIETSWEKRGREAGRIEGKIEGKHEGKLEGKLEVAGKLLTIGMEIEVIAEVTGLTIEEINRLKRSE